MSKLEQIDLTYITERIITIFCPAHCPEPGYTQDLQKMVLMLQSKHRDNYMLINLSQKHNFLSHLNHKILDTGWLDSLAPSLNQIFRVCTLIENWLQTHSKHVLVLHCRGGKGQLGVLLSSYIHFSNMSASADLSLDYFAMRRFYTDKLAALMTPSQKRYVWMMGSMLKDTLKMTPSPSFLLCVVLHGLLKMSRQGGCCLFLRVYQSLQTVCTSAVYDVTAAETDQLYFVLQPAQLLKGDIMVVCYNKNRRSASRRLVFRLQFHTGQVQGHTLTFFKADLDCASQDPDFPEGGKVDLLFADGPDRIPGREQWNNGPSVTVDYDTLDPVVRSDSYQDLVVMESAEFQQLDLRRDKVSGPATPSGGGERTPLTLLPPISPSCSDRAPSPSSDSGLSVASQLGPGPERGAALDRSPPQLDFEIAPPLLEVMAELAAQGRGTSLPLGGSVHREAPPTEEETAVLDDEERQATRGQASPAGRRPGLRRLRSVSSQDVADSETSTHRWVRRQQQMADVAAAAASFPEVDGGRGVGEAGGKRLPHVASRGSAVQRRLWDSQASGSNGDGSAHQNQDLASLTTDVDQSIEQLNQLILDLDPTFVPVETSCSPLSRSASVRSNYHSQKGNTHLSDWRWQKQLSDYAAPTPLHSSPGSPSPLHQRSISPYQGQGTPNVVPSTPAFPVSPPTPYDSRSFLKGLSSSGSSLTEGELFRPDVLATPAARQGVFGSMCSMSPDSPLPLPHAHTHSSTPDVCPNSQRSPRSLHSSSSSALSSPPGGSDGGPGSQRDADLSSLLLANGLEDSLLEAVESLESLNLHQGGGLPPPLLPEKRRLAEGPAELGSRSPSLSGFSSPHSGSSLSLITMSSTPDHLRSVGGAWSPGTDFGGKQQDTVKFVQDTSKYWYKSDISREQAVAVLKDREPGSFIVRDSHSFRGAYGLAVKVATPPPSVLQHSSKKGDPSNELVRHFLIECTQKGVRLKGCPNEPYFGSLTALVCQHSITPLALPCKLILPDKDPLEEKHESTAQTATNSAAELLKQGAACNVWYLGSVALESLTGHQAVQKATTQTISMDPPPPSTVVHFKVSAQGITLTDNQRKLFFRRHYAVNIVIFCSLDPQGRKWPGGSGSTAKIFGFVARKPQSDADNECHLFAEHDPEQPASAIVNFVSKVMIASNKQK